MSEAFESIRRGLEEAVEHAAGKPTGAIVHEISQIDVKSIRDRLEMNRTEFASLIGVSSNTLRAWEDGQRSPRGPALVLLHVIEAKPTLVLRTLEARSRTAA